MTLTPARWIELLIGVVLPIWKLWGAFLVVFTGGAGAILLGHPMIGLFFLCWIGSGIAGLVSILWLVLFGVVAVGPFRLFLIVGIISGLLAALSVLILFWELLNRMWGFPLGILMLAGPMAIGTKYLLQLLRSGKMASSRGVAQLG